MSTQDLNPSQTASQRPGQPEPQSPAQVDSSRLTENPRVVVFSSSCIGLPVIERLAQNGWLAAVVIALSDNPQKRQDAQQLAATLQPHGVALLEYPKDEPASLLKPLDQWQANIGLSFAFGEIFPAALIDYFQGRLINLHASDLPDYRGAMPIYWQIRQGADELPLTLHQVSARVDAGDIGLQTRIPLHPFDTTQSATQKMMQAAPNLVEQALTQLQLGTLNWQPQRSKRESDRHAPAPGPQDLQLNWNSHSAEDIAQACRAGNPALGFEVKTQFGSFHLMQASVQQQPNYGVPAGTVLMIDKQQGWVLATRQGSVSFDVVLNQNGYFSGYQFALLNQIEAGMCMSAAPARTSFSGIHEQDPTNKSN